MTNLSIQAAIGAFFFFVLSLGWLGWAWVDSDSTKSWTPTPAKVMHRDTARGFDRSKHRVRNIRGWLTTVSYRFNDVEYESVVDEYLSDSNVTIYVNPDNPMAIVATAGVRMQDIARPIIATTGTGLFGLVILLMWFSPKED